jgi:hypothetical protein
MRREKFVIECVSHCIAPVVAGWRSVSLPASHAAGKRLAAWDSRTETPQRRFADQPMRQNQHYRGRTRDHAWVAGLTAALRLTECRRYAGSFTDW